jgi:solute carrier family 50 protein (sugar transporter)
MIEILFPTLGVILTNLFGLSILRSYILNRDQLINEYNEILFYLILFNGQLWLLYGVIIKDIFISLSSITSIISSFGFIQIMYKHIKIEKKIYIEILTIIALLYILSIIFLLNFTSIDILIIRQIVGISCMLITFATNISPLLIIREVIIRQNTEQIYLPQIFINSINYLCWLIYAFILDDIFIIVTNTICLFILLSIFIIYLIIKMINNNSKIYAINNELI